MRKLILIILCFLLFISTTFAENSIDVTKTTNSFSIIGGIKLGSSVQNVRRVLNNQHITYEFKNYSSNQSEIVRAQSYGIFNPNMFYLSTVNIGGYEGSCHLYLDDDDKVSYAIYKFIVNKDSLAKEDPEKTYDSIEKMLTDIYGEAPYTRSKFKKINYLPISFEPKDTKISQLTNTCSIVNYAERKIDLNDEEEVIIQHYYYWEDSTGFGPDLRLYYNSVGYILQKKQQNDQKQTWGF